MPIRTATLRHQLEKNGAKLHLAAMHRVQTYGDDAPLSDEEQTLLQLRQALKAGRAMRRELAKAPHAPAPVREANPARAAKTPKAPKPPKPNEPKAPKVAKVAKPHLSRTELHEKKAAALAAAKLAARKSAAKH